MKIKLMAALCCAATVAHAHSGIEDEDVQARMTGMKDMAAQLKMMSSMAKGTTAFDVEVVEEALSNLSDEALNIPTLFEPQVDHPASEAKAEIWDSFDEFSELADDLHARSLAFSGMISEPADIVPAMRDIGQSCRACHTEFRE